MATGTDLDDLPPSSGRRPRSDLEEGEFLPSDGDDDLAGSEDDSPYALEHHHGGGGGNDARPEIKRRRLEFEGIVVDGGALPSPTPSSDRDSDGTISDVDTDAGAAWLTQKPLSFPCSVCPREFTSKNAASAHMRAHVPHGRQQRSKERTHARPRSAPISVGWAVTGKRGSVGRRSAPPKSGGVVDSRERTHARPRSAPVSVRWAVTGKRGSVRRRSVPPKSEGVVDSMAMVVPEYVKDPMPFAFACRSSSAEPNPPSDVVSMAFLVASSDDPTNQVVVHPPCSPQFLQGHQPAASQVVVAQAQPTVAQGQQLADASAAQFFVHQPAAPQVVQRTPPTPSARDEQGLWLCKVKGCDQQFATHQGLGGHIASHKRRQNNEAAATGLHLGVGDAACANKPAKLHLCKRCPSVFTSGYQLGGHMSKHRDKVILSKKHELTSAPAPSLPMPPTAMDAAPPQPAVAPRVLRLFGTSGAQLSGHMRNHYAGNVTPKKPGARPKASARQLASALELSLPMSPAAMDAAPPQPAVAPGVLRLFGVNIVLAAPPASATEEVSSAMTETDQSSAASTDIQH